MNFKGFFANGKYFTNKFGQRVATISPKEIYASAFLLPKAKGIFLGATAAFCLYYLKSHYHPEKTQVKIIHSETEDTKELASKLKSL